MLKKALEWKSQFLCHQVIHVQRLNKDMAIIHYFCLLLKILIFTAHENQKEPHLSVGTSFISAAHENQKEPHPSVGTSSISVPYSDTCSTAEKGRGNKSLDLLPALDRRPIPIGGVHSTQGADDIYVNKYFMNKAELMQKMRTWELEYKFEFRSRWSNKERVVLVSV
ncbi:uncharacterized protein LOC9330723 isoform X1 [Arabidopsis lyrata subsp. lyrata]|uniref:uncharacterized protein LOC9330723 isoform X1 n=2 Tax=Arabidopsis lyrata subsp. lyrata TaxID=81972 RepID=UPI000A29E1E2|nr:uncharacterized protein LOC9330723 isoform X1 [Arabidopsis lyrata subsp. lyrata]|eukprot:XP_020869964.1 uncharacterized protein LOC9330723 isoform X1 [Arabidopsis lyrata subsp. lyrata]